MYWLLQIHQCGLHWKDETKLDSYYVDCTPAGGGFPLTFHLHSEGIRGVLSQFQEHQLSQAKHLSHQIQFFIQARTRGLRALASFSSLNHGDVGQQRRDIQTYAKQIEKVYVKEISLHKEGTSVYSTDPNTIGSSKERHFILCLGTKEENKGKISLTPVFLDRNPSRLSWPLPYIKRSADSGFRAGRNVSRCSDVYIGYERVSRRSAGLRRPQNESGSGLDHG